MQIASYNKQDCSIAQGQPHHVEVDVVDCFMYEYYEIDGEIVFCFKDQNESTIDVRIKKDDLQEVFKHFSREGTKRILPYKKKRRILI